jgi:SAM-dependent methyltransferase
MTSPADAIIDLYQRHAATYDGLRGRLLMEGPWLARFRALLAPGATVLDIGCGTGQPIARHFMEQGHAVTGVDSAPAMIALCRARFPEGDWEIADMRKLALGRRFGGLIAWDSFFHLTPDDQRGMFKVFAAHAAPGAALMFTSGPAHGEAIGSFEGEVLYHGSLDPGEYRALLAENGFAVVDHVVEDPSCGGHTIWLAQAGHAQGAL